MHVGEDWNVIKIHYGFLLNPFACEFFFLCFEIFFSGDFVRVYSILESD